MKKIAILLVLLVAALPLFAMDLIPPFQDFTDLDINLVIVNYDESRDLKRRYGVTYQHTFVVIDSDGDAVTKWNGGSVDDIVMKAKAM